ncbi:hypothetical protein HPG69_002576, partial [Diceros bicornis minor]
IRVLVKSAAQRRECPPHVYKQLKLILESISPELDDAAYYSLAPSSGKAETELNENICRVEHELRSIPADSELKHSYITKESKNEITSLIILLPTHFHNVIK